MTTHSDTTPIALFIYGLPGAGKSTILSVADSHSIPSITMGEVVRKKARESLGEDFDSSALGNWATQQRVEHGKNIMAKYTRDEILAEYPDNPLVIVEGTRSLREIEVFESDFETRTLRVDAPFSARLHRVQARGRDGEDEFTPVDLIERDVREFDWGLGELFAADTPDYIIENDGTLAAYQAQATDILTQLTGTQSPDQ